MKREANRSSAQSIGKSMRVPGTAPGAGDDPKTSALTTVSYFGRRGSASTPSASGSAARACQARPRLKLKYSFGPARRASTLRSPIAAST
jgi:hypothetical protein